MLRLFFIVLCLATVVRAQELAAWQNADGATRASALSLARRAFDAYTVHREVLATPRDLPPLLRTRAAVFVSAMRRVAGKGWVPRCCMGSLLPTENNAAEEIIAAACAAAGRDRRFAPLRRDELREVVLIVSLVGAPRAISEAQARRLDPRRDGLAAHWQGRAGVVLCGETTQTTRMMDWARQRAGAPPGAAVTWSRLAVVRWAEGS